MYGSQEMPVAPNQLLLNGKVFLTQGLSNGNNHSLHQIYQYGFPFPMLPNLNSLPEKTASTYMSDAICSPSTPVTLDKNKRIHDPLPRKVIDIVDGSVIDRNIQGGELQHTTEEVEWLSFSNPMNSSHVLSFQQQEGNKNIVIPSEGVLHKPENGELGKRENQDIDLNKTPPQKPSRRKKHRPKVIKEGKPARKPATPKPITPKSDRNKESPSGKRKYVRKKKILDCSDTLSCPLGENVGQDNGTGNPSVRRCLNFDSGEAQAKDGCQGPSLIFDRNAEAQAQDACIAGTITNSNTKPDVPTVQRQKVVVDNVPARFTFDLNSSASQLTNEFMKIPQNPSPSSQPARRIIPQTPSPSSQPYRGIIPQTPTLSSHPSRRETLRPDHIFNEYIRTEPKSQTPSSSSQPFRRIIPQTPTPSSQPSRRETLRPDHIFNDYIRTEEKSPLPTQQSRREFIQENLKKIAWRNVFPRIAGNSNISLETGKKNQPESNITTNVPLRGTKRDHNLVSGECFSTHQNFIQAYNRINHISESPDTSRHGSYFPESHKRKRTEGWNELTPNAYFSVKHTPSSSRTSLVVPNNCEVFSFANAERPTTTSWKMTPAVPNNSQVFTFADAQRLMTLEKQRASECMLSFDQGDMTTMKAPKVPVQTNNLTSQSMIRICNNLSTYVKPSGFHNTDCRQFSTPEKTYGCNDSQESETCRPRTCTKALNANDRVKKKTKKCTMKEPIHSVKPTPSNTNQMCLQEDEAASCSYGSSDGKNSDQVVALSSENFQNKNRCLHVSSLQDCQSSSDFKESTRGISLSGAMVPHGDSVQDIVRKLKGLSIGGEYEIVTSKIQNALVPYGGGGGMVVPYEGPFDLTKKRRPRVKVDLDPETNRVWNVLMGKETSDEKMDMDKEKWWEKERKIFRGRVDSFIARMHLIQGDRRFSRWKGSVVDSVVGVFLTQNVSDHLSSSAYMALAARFPPRSNGDNGKSNAEKVSTSSEQRESCIIDLDDSVKRPENMSDQELCHRGSFLNPDPEHNAEKQMASSNEPLGCNTRGGDVCSNGEGCIVPERELGVGHESPNRRAGTPDTVTGSTTIGEAEDKRSLEDVVSSQNSAVSSQNSSEYLAHTADQNQMSLLSNFDADDLIYGGMSNGLDSSTSFLELLQMAETTRSQGLYSHAYGGISSTESCGGAGQLPCLDVDRRTNASDRLHNLKGECRSMGIQNSQPNETHHYLTGVSCAPSTSCDRGSSLNSSFFTMGNINAGREESNSNLLSNARLNLTNKIEIMGKRCGPLAENSVKARGQHDFMGVSCASSLSYHLHNSPRSRWTAVGDVNSSRVESSSHLPLPPLGTNTTNNNKIMSRRCSVSAEIFTEVMCQNDFTSVSCSPSPSCHLQNFSNSRFMANEDVSAVGYERSSHLPPTTSELNRINSIKVTDRRCHASAENSTKATSRTAPAFDFYAPISKHTVHPITCSESEVHVDKHSFCTSNLMRENAPRSSGRNTPNKSFHLQDELKSKLEQKERGVESQEKDTEHAVRTQYQMQSGRTLQTYLNSHHNLRETQEVVEAVESNLETEACNSQKVSDATENSVSKTNKVKPRAVKKNTCDWDNLRKQACQDGARKERSRDAMDSLDWEAIRCADVNEISQTIRERGMNNMLAERIKEFLDRIVKDHGSIDLEWLRDVPPAAAKDYLLSIRGLGLKSVECVRLLTLHHLAFPVDTNVGRICVRLGWVPLQPLPESLQLHLLEMYPVLETIQKYIWPRLCKLDQRTLYELHYQMITFGKVFCTKSKPNCNACPMRGECKHFASAFASARLALPGPEEKGLVSSAVPISFETDNTSAVFNPMPFPQLKGSTFSQGLVLNNCEPIIEEPATPEPELAKSLESDIEDAFYEDPDEIPIIKLNLEKFTQNIQNYMQENNMELQDGDLSKALVAITPDAASIPTPKLKNMRRLRTEHQVYELPDSHPLLEGLDQREPDDPCSYLLAIWSPGETAQSTELPQFCCNSQDTGRLCDNNTCFGCNSIREAQAQTVRGTLLIPCRTAMRGSFPLNGTYFQVNEVFADHDSSRNPISVPRELIWNLPRRTVYFGTSIPTIFKGLTTEGIQHCFWRGFVCVRGFDRTTRAPKPLYARLHFPVSKAPRKTAAAAAAAAATATAAREEQ